jgi:hypothetical protein
MKRVKYSLKYAVQKAAETRVLWTVIEFKERPDNVKALKVVVV